MKTKTQLKTARRVSRHNRIRARVIGTSEKPRLAVFKSNTGLYAQLIDDTKGATIVACSTLSAGAEELSSTGNISAATFVGKDIARLAIEKGITSVVFDRNGFLYHGRIKALAEAAREAGLLF